MRKKRASVHMLIHLTADESDLEQGQAAHTLRVGSHDGFLCRIGRGFLVGQLRHRLAPLNLG